MSQPIYVLAGHVDSARTFVRADLNEDPTRLRYVDRQDRIMGVRGRLLYVLNNAYANGSCNTIIRTAEMNGWTIARVDDTFARRYYEQHRELPR